jgi:hypothetical protein
MSLFRLTHAARPTAAAMAHTCDPGSAYAPAARITAAGTTIYGLGKCGVRKIGISAKKMRPAIICAMIATIITATLATTPVVIMDRDYRVWPSEYPMMVAPHTVTYALVAFTGLTTQCAVRDGCRCFRWRGTAKAVRWPPLAPGEQQCLNVSTRLVEASDSVVPLAALLPVAEIPILWPVVRERVCGADNNELGEALTELVVASSTRRDTVCARARVLPTAEKEASGSDNNNNPLIFLAVFAVLVVGVFVWYTLHG